MRVAKSTLVAASAWQRQTDPISIHLNPDERSMYQTVQTDNELFNKQDRHDRMKCSFDGNGGAELFSDSTFKNFVGKEEESFQWRGGAADRARTHFLQELSNFVDRLNSVALSIVQQLACLYQGRQRMYMSTFKFVQPQAILEALGSTLATLITLDTIIVENELLMSSWQNYKKLIQAVRADPERYGMTPSRVNKYERMLVSLDQNVLAGNMFRTCIEQNFEQAPGLGNPRVDVNDNSVFLSHMQASIDDMLTQCLQAKADQRKIAPQSGGQHDQLLVVYGLYVLYLYLCPQNAKPNEKMYKRMWEVQLKIPLLVLNGKTPWYPADFLRRIRHHQWLQEAKAES